MTNDPKIQGRLCINFEVDTSKYKKDYISFLYNIARTVTQDWTEEGLTLDIEEDNYVELHYSTGELNNR
tara:strand:+ start:344 stop:550 length:207 start_codon:yes stop_codon:yes gene_type:complete